MRPLNQEKFSEALRQLEQLLSHSRRAFLLGAGCSFCAGLPLMHNLTENVLDSPELSRSTKSILASLVQHFEGSTIATIEDYMSELIDLLSIAGRRSDCRANNCNVKLKKTNYSVDKLQNALSEIKATIAHCIESRSPTLTTHRAFIHAVHSTLQSGKLVDQSAVDYFTLNYDTLLEDALALERIHYSDGFSGGATGWWEQSCFDDKSVAARVFKIHGSIDWCQFDGEFFPRRVRPNVTSSESLKKVIIWPAATKYQETQRDPYAQMISAMRKTLRPNEGHEVVLAVCGYRFMDAHINIELDRALKESKQRLTIIAFMEDDEPKGQLKKWNEDSLISKQVRIYGNKGFYHGDDYIGSVDNLLWWKFENLTRLLRGER